MKPSVRAFFERPPDMVAKSLLGQFLVKKEQGNTLIGMITEVEAYFGENDLAAHARAGLTKRTAVLFGPAGHAYVFQTRHHFCLNVVTDKKLIPSCVLIRALEPISGVEKMMKNTGKEFVPLKSLLNGPAKLCKAFAIDKKYYGIDLTDINSPLFIAQNAKPNLEFNVSTRIGITKDKDRLLRYTIKGSEFLSR